MEEFFRSMGGEFADNRTQVWRAVFFIGLAIGLSLLAWLISLLRRVYAARVALREFAEHHAIAGEELALAQELARTEKLPTLVLFEHVDLFERATAGALALDSGNAALAARIGHLRRALAFDRLPDYTPLFSSRELPAETSLTLSDLEGKSCAPNETNLQVEFSAAAIGAVGETLELVLLHAREAPYRLHCVLRERTEIPDGKTRLTFGHDEMPQRMRSSEARTKVSGTVTIRPALRASSAEREELHVEFLEASVHELLVSSIIRVSPGRLVECSFTLEKQVFFGLRAVVLAADAGDRDAHHLRLELHGVAEHDRERLRAAIEKHSATLSSSAALPRKPL